MLAKSEVTPGLDAGMAPLGKPCALVIMSHKVQASGCGGSVEVRWRWLFNFYEIKWGLNHPHKGIQIHVNGVGITDI